MFLKGKIPFVRILTPLIAGIILGYIWPVRFFLDAGLYILSGLLLFIVVLLGLYKSQKIYTRKWIVGVLIHCFLLFAGCYAVLQANDRFKKTHFSGYHGDGLLVAVNNEPKLTNNILRFEVLALKLIDNKQVINDVSGKLLVALKIDSVHPILLNYGQTLMLPFRFTEVEPPYNPAEFNYKKYLADHQIYHQTFINQSQIVIHPELVTNRVIAFAIRLRQRLVAKFKTYLHDPQSASLASTLILGYRSELSKDIVNAYSRTGTLHVLSVSGMHVGIVFLVLAFILKPLNRNKHLRLLSACIIIILIWFYALITGFSPSVCRAAVMLSFVVLGKAIRKNQNTYNLIAISAFVLLIYNPYYLFDVGFQLSYLAVLGLVFLYPKIYHAVYCKYWLSDQIWSYCALSLAAQLATFPISLYYFHQFPVYFLVSNLFIVLPVLVIMYAGILFLFVPWSFILVPLGSMLNLTIQLTNNALFYIESLPFSTVNDVWITSFQYLMMYGAGGCLLWAILSKSKSGLTLSLVFILLLCCNVSFNTMLYDRNQEIIFYSLRKNTAVAYLKDRKAFVLSDLNANDKTLPFSVEPYLAKAGIVEKVYEDFNTDFRSVKRNFIKFGGYRILRWDKSFDKKQFTYPVKVDAVLLSGNPAIKIPDLNSFVIYSILLIDGTNSDYRIDKWKQQAKELDINVRILKKNPAYIVKL